MFRAITALAILVFPLALPAMAQIWDGGGSDDFLATAKNWNTNAVPSNNGTAILQFTGGVRPDPVAGQPWSLSGIGFQNTSSVFHLTGQPLTIGGAGLANTTVKGLIIDNNVVLSANQLWGSQQSEVRLGNSLTMNLRNLDLQGPGSYRFDGSISPGNIDITNGATVRLGGFVTCDVDLVGGTLEIATDNPQPAGTYINMGDNTYFKAVGTQTCDNGINLNGDVFFTGGGALHLDRGLSGGGELALDTTGSLGLGGGYTSLWNGTVVVEKGRLELTGAQPGVPMLNAGGLQVGDGIGDPATAEVHAMVPDVLQAGVPVIFKDGSLIIEGDQDFPFIDVRGGDLQVNGDFTAGSVILAASDRTATISGNWTYTGGEPYLPVTVPDGAADPDVHFTVTRDGGTGTWFQGGGSILYDAPTSLGEGALYVNDSSLTLARSGGPSELPSVSATNSSIDASSLDYQFGSLCNLNLVNSTLSVGFVNHVVGPIYLEDALISGVDLSSHGDVTVVADSEIQPTLRLLGPSTTIQVAYLTILTSTRATHGGNVTLAGGGTWDARTIYADVSLGAGTLVSAELISNLDLLGPQAVMEVPVRGNATLEIEEAMTMQSGSTLRLSIGHNAEFGEAYAWSRVGHTGGYAAGSTIDLAGTLDITLGPVFDIQADDEYVLVEAGTINGQFDEVIFPECPVPGHFWNLAYTSDGTQVVLSVEPIDGATIDLTGGTDASFNDSHIGLPGVAGIEFTLADPPGAKNFFALQLVAVRVDSIAKPIFGNPVPTDIGVRIYRSSDQALLASADDQVPAFASFQDYLFPMPLTLQAGETYRLVLYGGASPVVATRTANNLPADPASLLRIDGAYRTTNLGDIYPTDPSDELFLATLQLEMAGVSGVETIPEPVVTKLALNPAPNPFNPRTTVHFDIPKEGQVRVEVMDLRGRRVATLTDGLVPVGRHEVVFDGRTDAGEALPSGIYFVRLSSAAGGLVKKVTLLQ